MSKAVSISVKAMYIRGEFFDCFFSYAYDTGIQHGRAIRTTNAAVSERWLRRIEKLSGELAHRSINPFNEDITYIEIEYFRMW